MQAVELERVPEYYHRYIEQVREQDLGEALSAQRNAFTDFLEAIPSDKIDYSYAEGKWTLKELLQHILDGERIFAYRALCIARKEEQSLPGFDEDSYAASSKAAGRNWDEMINEFKLLRQTTEILFGSFDNEQLESSGIANNKSVYVKAIGFVMVGHINHHIRIISERYL